MVGLGARLLLLLHGDWGRTQTLDRLSPPGGRPRTPAGSAPPATRAAIGPYSTCDHGGGGGEPLSSAVNTKIKVVM